MPAKTPKRACGRASSTARGVPKRKSPNEARRWRTSARNRHTNQTFPGGGCRGRCGGGSPPGWPGRAWAGAFGRNGGWRPSPGVRGAGVAQGAFAVPLARQGLGRGFPAAVVAGGQAGVRGAGVAQGALAVRLARRGLAAASRRRGGWRPSPGVRGAGVAQGAHPPPRLGWAWRQAGRVNRGGRFSMKARTASRWSSVAAQRTKRSASIARQVFKSAPSARWMFSFM